MKPSVDLHHGDLRVSESGRHLIHADGTLFFYLGDTAWELFHRLTLAEIEEYLENRRKKGFTVIQASILAELDGLDTPNRNGDRPLKDKNPATPNEPYFQFVDRVVKLAESMGLFFGLVPVWGDKVDLQAWGVGPVVFNRHNAGVYGRWLGDRYKTCPNIIWIVGGDRAGGTSTRDKADGRVVDPEVRQVWEALATGIKAADSRHLMTFHSWDKNGSSYWFHQSPWLDFNLWKSGHLRRHKANFELIEQDYRLTPPKPTMDGEPCYEDHPINFDPANGCFDDTDVRQAAWWAVISGACGHTYGCHPVWQFYDQVRKPVAFARHSWREALDLPGANQMILSRRLVEARPWQEYTPDQSLVLNACARCPAVARAGRGTRFIVVYVPDGRMVELKLGVVGGHMIRAKWMNPRTGKITDLGERKNQGSAQFTPPADGMDWVLLLDDTSANFTDPEPVERRA